MPSVIDAPEMVEHEAQTLYEAHPHVRVAHSGFWHTLVAYLRRYRVHTPYGRPSSSHGSLHPIEMPADLLARQYPSLYIRAYAGV